MPGSASTVYSRIANSEHVRPLSKRDFGYLQVVLSSFELHRRRHGRRLQIELPVDPQTIIAGTGKRCIEHEARSGQAPGVRDLERQLAEFEQNANLLGCRFECADWPMRFANGGVLPVIQLDGRDYFLMFYRDIFPIGWNIANGASDNTDEWLDPTRIIQREFGEELLLCDPTARRLFIYDPPGPARPVGFHEDAIQAWSRKRPDLAGYERVPMPLKWIDGPDSVRVTFRDRVHECDGVFLSVTPADHGIEVDRVALIRLSGDVRFLDGEIVEETLLNHVVGLFETSALEGDRLASAEFKPDRVFFNGQEFDPGQLEGAIAQYLRHVEASGLRRDDQVADYARAEPRFDLCPISRAVIERYFEWRKLDQQERPPQPVVPAAPRDGRPFDVFISHRSTNVGHARALHDYLSGQGHSVFFSDETLAQGGESDYGRAIGRALDQARILILLALDPADLESGWVDFEWKAFHCELLSGRKQGHIFTFLHNVGVNQLPLPLRSRQSINFSPTSQYDSFENLYRYVGPALASGRGAATGA
jgi:hypothetical protein